MILVKLAGDKRFPDSCSYSTRPLFNSLSRMLWAGTFLQGRECPSVATVRACEARIRSFCADAVEGMNAMRLHTESMARALTTCRDGLLCVRDVIAEFMT